MISYIKDFYARHKESWLFTLASDLLVYALVGLSTGALDLMQGGDLSYAALKALITSVLVATVRSGLREVQTKVEGAKNQK